MRSRVVWSSPCVLWLLLALPAQNTPAPEAALLLRVFTPTHFDGASVSIEIAATPTQPQRRLTVPIAGMSFELALPTSDLPTAMRVAWGPRIQLEMPLPDGAASALTAQTDGRKLLELYVVNHALVLTRGTEPVKEWRILSGRFGGRRGETNEPKPEQKAATDGMARAAPWLHAQQLADGSWPGTGKVGECLPTAAACSALLGAGNNFRSGPQAAALRRALGWLVAAIDPHTGRVRTPSDAAPLEEQAMIALVLSEAHGLSNFAPLEASTSLTLTALSAMLEEPQVKDRADAAALGFAALALVSAREFRLTPAPDTLTRATARLDGGDDVAPLRDAASLVLGYFTKNPELTAAERRVPRLLANLPKRGATMEVAYVYFATYAMFQTGQPHWSTWTAALAPAIVAEQVADGELAGSWQPGDPRAQMRGRCWTTAMRLVTLQTCHRFMR